MEKTGEKVTRYYSCDRPEFFVEVVKCGKGRGCEWEAWIGKDGYGVMDFMFGCICDSEQEFLNIVECNLPEYADGWELEHGEWEAR